MVAAVGTTDYGADLAAVQRELDEVGHRGDGLWDDAAVATRFVFRTYHRASLVGDEASLLAADATIESAIAHLGAAQDLCLLKACIDLRLHRFAAVAVSLGRSPTLGTRPQALAVLGEAALARGQIDVAGRYYDNALAGDPSWENIARVAHLYATRGDYARAEQWYDDAQASLSAKEMRAYAWLEVTRGALDVENEQLDAAAEHYARAEQAYSGWWTVGIARAALAAAMGRSDAAVALYAELVDRCDRPELWQALGDALSNGGYRAEARRWHERALDAYLRSTSAGQVQYLHHLVDLYAKAYGDVASALECARRDVDLRPSAAARVTLARVLLESGLRDEAAAEIAAALATGARSRPLLAIATELDVTTPAVRGGGRARARRSRS